MATDTTHTSAEALVDVLEAEGVEMAFGLPGSQILEVVDGIERREGMTFVGARHEQGAAFMAEGYARAARAPGVCLSTVGPGATNLVTGVASAFKGYVPVLALTGKHARWQQERNTFQEIDQKELFAPVTRYSRMAAEPADLPKLTRKAFRLMTDGPRGPAQLTLPKDTQTEVLEDPALDTSAYHPAGGAAPTADGVDDVLAAIDAAERPVLLAGYDVVWEDAVDDLAAFAEALGAPVVTSSFHLDAFPTTHDLAMGPIGPGFWASANDTVAEADLVVAVGAHFDFLSTHFRDRILPADAAKVQVHSDAANVGAVYPLEAGLACDVTPFLEAATERLDGDAVDTAWNREALAERKRAWFAERAADGDDTGEGPVHPATTVRAVREAAPDSTRFTIDGGNFLKHVIRQLDTTVPNTYINNANFGTVGSAFPLAVGAATAVPDPVVCLTGDGGMALNCQELETAARIGADVTVVVFNDYGMGNVRSYQKYVYGERYTGVDFGDQDFVTVAEGFGVAGQRVDAPGDARAAIEAGLAHDGPFVVDVETDAGALEPPVFMKDDGD
jgi:thiamine pyrophosphate-dependent acetolactate synthase large subunit-like protein